MGFEIDNNDLITRAEQEIFSTYGDTVSVAQKSKTLIKYGRNEDLDTTDETVFLQGGLAEPANGNLIDSIISDNASDTQVVNIEGLTISGSDLTFVSQNVTLNGTTAVTLATPLNIATRLENKGSTDLVGNVEVYESVATTIHISTKGIGNRSLKAASGISSLDYYIVTEFTCSVRRNTGTRSVDFQFQTKTVGGVWINRYPFSSTAANGTITVPVSPYLIIPKNTYFRINAVSSGNSTFVNAAVHGILAKII